MDGARIDEFGAGSRCGGETLFWDAEGKFDSCGFGFGSRFGSDCGLDCG
jgi:hypothetical protein